MKVGQPIPSNGHVSSMNMVLIALSPCNTPYGCDGSSLDSGAIRGTLISRSSALSGKLRVWYTRPRERHGQGAPLLQRWQHFRTSFRPHLEHFLLEVSLIEYVFTFPGLGSLGIEALKRRDFPVLQGFILCMGALYFVLRCLCEWHPSPRSQAQPRPPVPQADTPGPSS